MFAFSHRIEASCGTFGASESGRMTGADLLQFMGKLRAETIGRGPLVAFGSPLRNTFARRVDSGHYQTTTICLGCRTLTNRHKWGPGPERRLVERHVSNREGVRQTIL
jgi:hypothetical protein